MKSFQARPSLARKTLAKVMLVAAALAVCGSATAQQNLEKLKQFRVATTDLNIPTVTQTGRKADQLRANLQNINLNP